MLTKSTQKEPTPFVVEGLIYEKTVNLIVGDSGIGKTPFLVSLAVAVASGKKFFGRDVKQGPVLYCDAEMTLADFEKLQRSISSHMGLAKRPSEFFMWSLYGEHSPNIPVEQALASHVEMIKPALVIIDPLRTFFPTAESKSDEATEMFKFQKMLATRHGCAWANLHHRRKLNSKALFPPDLEIDPMAWLLETAGSRALVNHSDLRLGIEAAASGGADLIVGGFRRGHGTLAPFRLGRHYDDSLEPVGYDLLTGVATLSPAHQAHFNQLPMTFRFADVRGALGGTSDSAAARFLDACKQAGLIVKEGEKKNTIYKKTN